MSNKAENNNQKPDFRKTETSTFNKGKFPIQILEEYRVQIDETAYLNMKTHAKTTDKVELCGVLVGNVLKDEKGIFLKLDAIIEGRDASSQGAQVTFTHQTWNHINDVMDKSYPNKQIIGWYHTHPGFGVFLSGMDIFIQENFFNQPYQIAIVLETHAHEEGCYVWVDGVSTPLVRYWVGTQEIKLAGHKPKENESNALFNDKEQNENNASITAKEYLSNQNSKPQSLYTFLLAILLLMFGFIAGQLYDIYSFKKLAYESIESELYSIQDYASINALAKEDLKEIRTAITEINSDKITPEDKLKKNIDLIEQITKLEAKYSENRNSYRKKLQELANYKNSLSTRVNDNSIATRQIEDLIADLYILRLSDLDKNLKKSGISKLSAEDTNDLQILCRQILAISPDKKQLLFKLFPEMMKAFYPENNPKIINEPNKNQQ